MLKLLSILRAFGTEVVKNMMRYLHAETCNTETAFVSVSKLTAVIIIINQYLTRAADSSMSFLILLGVKGTHMAEVKTGIICRIY